MPKFRKKPVVIEAEQFIGSPLPAGCRYGAGESFDFSACYVDTLEGVMRADLGDWIITGVKGEKYPCKPDIFAATYEPVQSA